MMRAALYARVSTNNGHQDPEMQLRELREYCASRGWEMAGEYVDKVSGTRERREHLDALMAGAYKRQFDAILVWKLDRFARSLKHLVNMLSEFESLGVAFVSLKDSLDLSTPAGRLQFHIIAAMAEFERSLIVERVKAGLRNAKAKGRRLGRPRASADASRIAALRAQGLSWRDIGRETGLPEATARRALSRCVKNPAAAPSVIA